MNLQQHPPKPTSSTKAGYNVLVRGATSLLSQSGLANLERACESHLVVSGNLDGGVEEWKVVIR